VVKEALPITSVVESICDSSCGAFSLEDFREHVAPLKIEAKGEVLIIGPGLFAEEFALIEPQIAAGLVERVVMIDTNRTFAQTVIERAGECGTEINIYPKSVYSFFDSNKTAEFDTIIFIGTISRNLFEKIDELPTYLRSGGRLYLTVNGRLPRELPELEGCRVEVIPDIPPNPNYDWVPNYFGVVVKKE
jgi:hypothetical protein